MTIRTKEYPLQQFRRDYKTARGETRWCYIEDHHFHFLQHPAYKPHSTARTRRSIEILNAVYARQSAANKKEVVIHSQRYAGFFPCGNQLDF
ncbi:MAG: hypothetical protein Q7S26_00730 [bacterium]|nr:hypothetical protein [bacterium]